MEKKNWINKLDELEGDQPAPARKSGMNLSLSRPSEDMILYGLAGVVGLILILVIVLFFRTGREASYAEVDNLHSRLENLESQMNRFEHREEERQRVIAQYMQSDQDLKSRLDAQRETIDDLRQKIAALEKAAQRPAPAPPAPAQTPPRQETRPAPAAQDKITHEVQRGENLFRIGLQYNISVDELLRLNNLSPNDSIHPGQKIIVGTKNN